MTGLCACRCGLEQHHQCRWLHLDQRLEFCAVVTSNCSVAPVCTVRVKQLLESIVTVAPVTIVALSPGPGTTPPTQVAPTLQLPPAPVELDISGWGCSLTAGQGCA